MSHELTADGQKDESLFFRSRQPNSIIFPLQTVALAKSLANRQPIHLAPASSNKAQLVDFRTAKARRAVNDN